MVTGSQDRLSARASNGVSLTWYTHSMRTVLFLASGFLLLTAVFILGKLFSENFASATTWATFAFLMLWLIITGANMWIGVTKAGYSASEELPILLLLFGVPAAVALLLKWKVL